MATVDRINLNFFGLDSNVAHKIVISGASTNATLCTRTAATTNSAPVGECNVLLGSPFTGYASLSFNDRGFGALGSTGFYKDTLSNFDTANGAAIIISALVFENGKVGGINYDLNISNGRVGV